MGTSVLTSHRVQVSFNVYSLQRGHLRSVVLIYASKPLWNKPTDKICAKAHLFASRKNVPSPPESLIEAMTVVVTSLSMSSASL
jgi:hypothetical protein